MLDLGAGAGHIARALVAPLPPLADGGGGGAMRAAERIETLVAGELSPRLLHRDALTPANSGMHVERVVLDEEAPLPFGDGSFDAVVSAGMHWINDLPAALAEAARVLRADAPLVAAMPAGDTLFELRAALQLAELERRGGVGPRVSPLIDPRDLGGLLGRAGFALVTVDVADVVVGFPDVFALMADLQAMGEANAVLGRPPGPLPRDVLMAAQAIYRELYGAPDGSLPATFRIVYMVRAPPAPPALPRSLPYSLPPSLLPHSLTHSLHPPSRAGATDEGSRLGGRRVPTSPSHCSGAARRCRSRTCLAAAAAGAAAAAASSRCSGWEKQRRERKEKVLRISGWIGSNTKTIAHIVRPRPSVRPYTLGTPKIALAAGSAFSAQPYSAPH